MKCVERDQHLLRVLKGAKSNLTKAILQNCDDRVIQTLSEILHNTMIGNVTVDPKHLRKMKRYKKELRSVHGFIRKNKLTKSRRRRFVKQVGGFWPALLGSALTSLLTYGAEKLMENGKS